MFNCILFLADDCMKHETASPTQKNLFLNLSPFLNYAGINVEAQNHNFCEDSFVMNIPGQYKCCQCFLFKAASNRSSVRSKSNFPSWGLNDQGCHVS